MKKIIITTTLLFVVSGYGSSKGKPPAHKPNIIYIVVDQWRAQATGYSGDKNVLPLTLQEIDSRLDKMFHERKDEFLPGMEYVKKWNYTIG